MQAWIFFNAEKSLGVGKLEVMRRTVEKAEELSHKITSPPLVG
jgi:hypothetical protein